MTFELTLSAPSTATVGVDARTATAPHAPATTTAQVRDASSSLRVRPAQTVSIPVFGDTHDEPDETFELRLARPANATLATGRGIVAIVDDDEPEPQCSNAVDNDLDGHVDFGFSFANDRGCASADDDDESGGSSSYHTDPPATVSTEGDAVVLRKELGGYGNYGRLDGRSDVLYSGQSDAWTFDLGGVPRPPSPCVELRARLVLDDHYGRPPSDYVGRILINGAVVFDGTFASGLALAPAPRMERSSATGSSRGSLSERARMSGSSSGSRTTRSAAAVTGSRSTISRCDCATSRRARSHTCSRRRPAAADKRVRHAERRALRLALDRGDSRRRRSLRTRAPRRRRCRVRGGRWSIHTRRRALGVHRQRSRGRRHLALPGPRPHRHGRQRGLHAVRGPSRSIARPRNLRR